MVKGLLRRLTRKKSKNDIDDLPREQILGGERTKDDSCQHPEDRDVDTGEEVDVEIIDDSKSLAKPQKEKKKKKHPEVQSTQNRARNEAYIRGIKGLMSMNLDADIFTNAMDELKEKYYGKSQPPDEVMCEVDKIVIDVKFKD